MKTQIHQGITREEYIELTDEDGNPLENQSKAKSAIKSAWHYYMDHMNPKRPIKEPTSQMQFGTIAHELAIEDTERFAVWHGERRGNKWNDFKLKCEHESKIPITHDSGTVNELDIRGAAASAKEALSELGADLDPECAITFEQFGVNCKMLVDRLSHDCTIYDLKFTGMIERIEYHIFDQGWDFQSAWYKNGVKKAFNLPHEPRFVIIAVEPKYPYEWTHCELHGNAVELAQRRVEIALSNLKKARETNDWSHKKRASKIIEAPLHFYNMQGDDE